MASLMIWPDTLDHPEFPALSIEEGRERVDEESCGKKYPAASRQRGSVTKLKLVSYRKTALIVPQLEDSTATTLSQKPGGALLQRMMTSIWSTMPSLLKSPPQ